LKALKKEADERLLIEAAQKDPARFAELYEINFERVYAYVVRRAGNRESVQEPADQPYGDRNSGVTDLFGNTWYIVTHIKDVAT
jgi:uncharacterized glyoxalase superfamily protein PhnB